MYSLEKSFIPVDKRLYVKREHIFVYAFLFFSKSQLGRTKMNKKRERESVITNIVYDVERKE